MTQAPDISTDDPRGELEGLIAARDYAAVKARAAQMETHDLAELLAEMQGEDMAVVFRLLPRDLAAETLGNLASEQQEKLVSLMSSERQTAILNDMAPDERTDLLEELPGEVARRLINTLRGDERVIAQRLLAYPEDSIGRLMTPEYVAAKADWTVRQVFDHIRQVGGETETLNVIFVVDADWRLRGKVSLEQLVLAEPDSTVADIMDPQPPSLQAADDQEASVEIVKKYDAVALPVVDSRQTLVGIVTVDDVLDVAEEETTEDFQKMAGMGPLEYSYFSTGFGAMILKRLPWLIMLLMAQLLTTLALTSFQIVPLFAALVIFMPLINSPAGNTGSQMAGLMLRGLAVQEVTLKDWRRVLLREILRGLAIGIILAGLGYVAAHLFGSLLHGTEAPESINSIATSIAIAIVAAVTMANVLGAMLPFVFKRVGLDPAVTSGPFIASMMDVLGVVVYFTTASLMLARMN